MVRVRAHYHKRPFKVTFDSVAQLRFQSSSPLFGSPHATGSFTEVALKKPTESSSHRAVCARIRSQQSTLTERPKGSPRLVGLVLPFG